MENHITQLLSFDPKEASETAAEVLTKQTFPLMLQIRNKLQNYHGPLLDEDFNKIHNVFVLCSSQIQKCFLTLFSIFKVEYEQHVILQDTRQCLIERLSWCVNRLHTIELILNSTNGNIPNEDDCSMLVTPIYFVHWIDHTFEELEKLANVIYKNDCKGDNVAYTVWKNDVIECVSDLHITIDELLLSAMTLCKYCLPADQLVVKARSQVVLRESKALLSELFDGDMDTKFKACLETLKLPIMPSNVNVLIDVLKDVLYALETNTNTALLALLVHCFSFSISPVDVLKDHFMDCKGTCSCHVKSEDEVTEDCSFVKDFDLYNERLLQIGSFAVSCSSDLKRITPLRSGLASLEALDPHLVPALMMSPMSPHATLMMDSWRQEVQDIRDGVFLIVDPAAFAEKSKQMMHEVVLSILKCDHYDNTQVRSVIDIGGVLRQLFTVYRDKEPAAINQYDKLMPLLDDLDKVQMECKIVSNLLCKDNDLAYKINQTSKSKEVTFEQLKKRLKLLYTIVSRINSLFHPKDNEDQLFACEIDELTISKKNVTRTIYLKNDTFVNSPRKPENVSRSIFARTKNLKSSTRNFPLSDLTKHLKAKRTDNLSFSIQLDELCNLSEVKKPEVNMTSNKSITNKQVNLREPSVLYKCSPNNRASLRKFVMKKHFKMAPSAHEAKFESQYEREGLVDDTTSLQITEILNQITDMSQAQSNRRPFGTVAHTPQGSVHTLKIPINKSNSIAKHIWKIPINATTVEVPLEDSESSVVTEPSNFSTLERVQDICLVESKLNCLKSMEETSL